MEEYLFGEQPVVPPPILKPLTSSASVTPTPTKATPTPKVEPVVPPATGSAAQPTPAANAERQIQVMKDIHDAALRLGRNSYMTRVRLADLRAALPQYSRAEIDQALNEMQVTLGGLALMHLDDPLDVKDADREAAIYQGGQTNEILYMKPDMLHGIAKLRATVAAQSEAKPTPPQATPTSKVEPVADENKALFNEVDAATKPKDRKRIEADYGAKGKKAIFVENNINEILKEAEENGKVTKQCP
jgi:hypothetical protein